MNSSVATGLWLIRKRGSDWSLRWAVAVTMVMIEKITTTAARFLRNIIAGLFVLNILGKSAHVLAITVLIFDLIHNRFYQPYSQASLPFLVHKVAEVEL